MKQSIKLSAQVFSLLLLSTPVWADSVVTTSGDTVTITQTPSQTPTQVVLQPAGTQAVVLQSQPVVLQPASQVVVLQSQPVIVMEQRDPRRLEGRIKKIELIKKRVTIYDINGIKRRVYLLKPSMINNYKLDDYVQIYLTRDLKEAMTVQTKQVPDFEGDIVSVDLTSNVIVIHEVDGSERRVIVRPDMIQTYQVGTRARFYVVSENTNYKEAKIIRID